MEPLLLFGGLFLIFAATSGFTAFAANRRTRIWRDRMAALGLSAEGRYPSLSARGSWREFHVEVRHVSTPVGKSTRVTHFVTLSGNGVGPAMAERLTEAGHGAMFSGEAVTVTGDQPLEPGTLYAILELAASAGVLAGSNERSVR